MNKFSLLLLVCMVSMLAVAQSNSPSPDDSSGGGPISHQGFPGIPSPDDSTVGDMGRLTAAGNDQSLSDGCVQLFPDAYDFGQLAVDFPSPAKPFYLRNGCSAPVVVTSVAATDPSYTQTNACIGTPIPADGYCEIQVTVTPSSRGIHDQHLIVTDNEQGSSQQMQQFSSLTNAPVADVTMTPTSCDFLVPVGGSGPSCYVTLQNNESKSVTIDSIEVTTNPPYPAGTFSQLNNCPKSLAKKGQPEDSCVITVSFWPQYQELATGKLKVKTDSLDGTPPADPLTGRGFIPKCQPPGCGQ